MNARIAGTLLFGLGALFTGSLGEANAEEPVAVGSDRLVDGVSLADYEQLQLVLLESAAGDREITVLDEQLMALRAQRMELNFKAAIRDHPELAEKLQTVLRFQRERRASEDRLAREAARLQRKKQ